MLNQNRNTIFRDYFAWAVLAAYAVFLVWLASDQPELLLFYRNLNYKSISIMAACVLSLTYIYLFITGILCIFYRPTPSIRNNQLLPTCTVIVPAYNEGAHVEETIDSLLDTDYPREKLKIIVVNDGSQDDTWEYMSRGAAKAPDIITAINLPRNCGKKNAICLGVKMAKSEVIVTVDSDSSISPGTLRALVSPIRVDRRVAAVAGSLRVKDPERDIIASIFDVMMVFGCEFLRAAQSVTGLALCTPGALSCYRRSVLLPLMDEWMAQTFMGKPSHIGEDRALATLILRGNHRIVHQRTAVVRTCVPDTLKGTWKMLLRWNRGDMRENLRMAKLTICSFPHWNVRIWIMSAYWIALIQNIAMAFLFIPSFVMMLLFTKAPSAFLAANAFMALFWALIPASIYVFYTRPRKAVWAFLYGAFFPYILSLLTTYCFLTLGDSRWMTREIKKKK